MKLLSRLAAAIVICVLAVPILAFIAPIQAQVGEIWLDPDDEGYVGDEIRVLGEGLDEWAGTVWVFYQTNSEWEMVDEEYIDSDGYLETDSFEIPESAGGTHEIRICDNDDEDDWFIRIDFTVNPKLEITSPTSLEGSVGTQVRVRGTGFGEDEEDIEIRFYLDGSDYKIVKSGVTADEYGSWEVTFAVPAANQGDHRLDAEGDDSSLSDVEEATFEVKPGMSVSKSSGYVGDAIVVSGSGFEEDERGVKVTYDGDVVKETEADGNGSWEVSFNAPASATGKHTIDAYGQDTGAADVADGEFTVLYKGAMNPTAGNIGTTIMIGGTGFAASQPVSIKYDGTQVATSTTDSKGNFSSSFPVPKSKHGDHTVVASDASGNTFASKFVIESTPPAKPALVAPANGSRIGFVGKVTPRFEWQSVNDPSGVSYSFEMATSVDFTSPILSRTDLGEANYALTSGQALDYGTYYWRVKAIDGAENDSGWTDYYSFRSGLLTLWAFIVIIALVAVLIGALVYLLTRKKGKVAAVSPVSAVRRRDMRTPTVLPVSAARRPDMRTPINPMAFGDVNVGGSLRKTTTIYNDGDSPLTIYNITRTSGVSEFSYVGPKTPFDLAGGASVDITISFVPTSGGSREATFDISSNDPDEANVFFSVSGNGVSGRVTTVSISPFSQVVSVGQSFTVNVTVVPAVATAGLQFDLSFDPSLVAVNNVTEGNLLKHGGANTYFAPGTIDNSAGTIRGVAAAIVTPGQTVSSPGTFATISLTVKTARGTSTLNLSNAVAGDMGGHPVIITINSGSVTVGERHPWDVNNDQKVNVLDMIRVGQHWGETGSAGWIPEDVNNDGQVNVLDMILTGQHWTG